MGRKMCLFYFPRAAKCLPVFERTESSDCSYKIKKHPSCYQCHSVNFLRRYAMEKGAGRGGKMVCCFFRFRDQEFLKSLIFAKRETKIAQTRFAQTVCIFISTQNSEI